jgi:hypothetical protein
MQKIRVAVLMIGMCASSFFVKVVKGAENNSVLKNSKMYVSLKADEIYNKINFGNEVPLSKEVFRSAYTGFLNLQAAGKLNSSSAVISICDFSLSSNVKRLWVINMEQSKVLFHSLVAHGQGTGDEFAENFSNNENSHQSSLGFFITDETYNGDNGYSLKLKGMDAGYNDAAYNRSIVVHGADYVCESYIRANQRLGRSWGCPALPRDISQKVINTIKNGTCFYIYYPNKNYLARSVWLNKMPIISEENLLKQRMENLTPMKPVNLQSSNTAVTADIQKAAPKPVADPNAYQGVRLAVGSAQ